MSQAQRLCTASAFDEPVLMSLMRLPLYSCKLAWSPVLDTHLPRHAALCHACGMRTKFEEPLAAYLPKLAITFRSW